MYRNVVSTRELLSDSFSSERHDSRDHSQQYSQLPYSQPEFSQISSQDMFTQQFSNGSQTEVTNNVSSRKPTLYDKWKNKATVSSGHLPVEKGSTGIASLGSRPPSLNRCDLSFQQQLQINKTKAKERDERDFLQQVVNTVQDCTKEVKLTLNSVWEKLQHSGDQSEQNLQLTITSFLDDLSKQQDRILSAVQEKDISTTKYHDLEKELALREAKMKTLEKTVEDQKYDASEKIIRALQKHLHSPQQKVDSKLAELLETTRENHEQYTLQIQEQKQQLEHQQKLYSELKKSQQTQVKDSEKRLFSELSNLRKEIRKKENTCLQDILDQLKSAQEQQFEELESHVSGILDRSDLKDSNFHQKQGLQKNEVQEILKKNWNGIERIVEAQFRKHLKLQEEQLGEAVEKITQKENRNDQTESFLSLPQFENKMGQYHEDFKKQVESLHDRHIQELKQLRSEMTSQQKNQNELSATLPTVHKHVEMFKLNQESNKPKPVSGLERKPESASVLPTYQLSKGLSTCNRNGINDSRNSSRHESAVLSPLTANYKKLNTRSFFSKTAFSPVATVLPQRKETQEGQISNLTQENYPPVDDTITVPTSSKKRKKRKKKSRFSKPKKTKCAPLQTQIQESNNDQQRQFNMQSLMKQTERISTFGDVPKAAVPAYKKLDCMPLKVTESGKNISVYDFRDEDLPSQLPSKNVPFYGSRTQSYTYSSQKKGLMTVNTSQTVTFPRPVESLCSDSLSRESSPSLSITEVVVKRRIKCDRQTPDISLHFNNGFQKLSTETQFPVYDILSTPSINAVSSQQNKSLWTYKQNKREPQTVRRAGEKRRLCDVDINPNIIQSLRNQNKRICQ